MATFAVVKIGLITVISFFIALFATPILTHFLYKYKLGKQIRDGNSAPIFAAMHKDKAGTPTMGGVLIWATVFLLALAFSAIAKFFPGSFLGGLNFLTREQTLLPLGALVMTALIGLADDYLGVKKIGPKGGGLDALLRLGIFLAIALVGALWFYFKLDRDVFHIPFLGDFIIGWWYVPLFIFIVTATTFSVNETDGLDGLAGGVLVTIFAALGAISFAQGRFELTAFCGAVIGALVAFLWFNINPARFFMGDTGAMSLGVTVGVIAMLTDTAILLPIIGFILLVEALSVIIQVLSKKFRKKKVFLSAPIHHHFQAKGWPEPKIVMRFWLISGIMTTVGMIIFLMDKWLY
ncbi:MAG: phospho-N-acetylmuramoyl-pentapeptide-transferase [Parcubacteria group bacterium]